MTDATKLPSWSAAAVVIADTADEAACANGCALADGDSVIVIKDLRIKGSSLAVKGGTKVRNIRLRTRPTGTTSAASSTASARVI
jgi:protein PhnA